MSGIANTNQTNKASIGNIREIFEFLIKPGEICSFGFLTFEIDSQLFQWKPLDLF